MAVRTRRSPSWRDGRVTSWLTTLDHKRIGILYIVTSFFFFFAAGLMALLMRTQLAQANNDVITENSYNQLFTIHGTMMIFLFVVPILAGFGNYLVPLMIGAKDMAFPRLNALSYWLFLLGGLVILSSFFADGGAASSGWTAYTPLSTEEFSPGNGQDLWILGLHLTSLSSLAGAINFIVTIHNMRTPGMTWMRIPLFVWTIEAYAVMLLLVLPTISAAVTLLLLDRQAGTSFFTGDGGARPLAAHVLVLRPPGGLHHGAARDGDDLRGRSRSSRGSRSSATRRSPSRRSASPSPACSSGRTTCSRWGCPIPCSGGS